MSSAQASIVDSAIFGTRNSKKTNIRSSRSRICQTRRDACREAIAKCIEPLESRVLLSGAIQVTVINDTNQNAVQDAGEPPLAGWTVYIDADKDGALDHGETSAVTDANGQALFANLPTGKTDVREILPSGWTASPGLSDLLRVNVNNNQTTQALFLNTNGPVVGSASGTVWNDVNGDGIRDPEDTGIPGWTVFIDQNTNRILDVGEPSTTTDVNGVYTFANLTPGTYKIRDITPAGWNPALNADGQNTVTVTAGHNSVSDFGNFNVASRGDIKGTVWNDVNADGVRAAGDPGLGGWTVYLDLNSNGSPDAGEPTTLTDAAGAYTFPAVVVGNYRVGVVLQDGWNLSSGHPAIVTATVAAENPGRADFAVFTPTLGTISGKAWNDANADGILNAGEPGLDGWTVFIDQNSDGVVNAGEPSAVTDANGDYTLTGVPVGSSVVREIPAVGWSPTAPGTGMQLVVVENASVVTNINFGNKQRTDGAISGIVYFDANHNSTRDAGERGLAGVTVYLDANDNGVLDPSEQSTVSSADLFYTPSIDETGAYSFTHLPVSTYHVREVLPAVLSGTPAAATEQTFDLAVGENKLGVNFADVFRANEIHGMIFDDVNQNHVRDPGEAGIGGVSVYLDLNRDNIYETSEPRTITAADGTYSFVTDLKPGSYVIRELHQSGREHSYPTTTGGILWPSGVSNPAVGNVTPTSITTSLAEGQVEHDNVSLTLPGTGSISNMVDVFLLFDDTGSFTANSPIVRAAFPQIISSLQAAMPTVDFGFGVGRFEEYANFAGEFATGRPFILNQPIVDQSTPGFSLAIQSALDRTAPGYGGDTPETDIEALYQLATGRGFDGNNNGTTSDSGAAGLVSTQLTPGASGDVPAFASFTVDPIGNVLPAAGPVGGAGFRPGALPIVLLATDTGFAFQPTGATTITGINGLTLPMSALTQTSRPTTPFGSGANIQDTITALNALGALVIGLGTNGAATVDPRQDLEAIAKLTGAINRSLTTIPNGTLTPIAPGDPFYFQISSGFGASVANGVVNAIENGALNVAVNIALKASDPSVKILSTPDVIDNVAAGGTATFDVAFTGDGRPHRFDLEFVRQGTDVVLGSIPVVIGTPIVGDGYEYQQLEDGQIAELEDFGSWVNPLLPTNTAPTFTKGADQSAQQGAAPVAVSGWATGISTGSPTETDQALDFVVTNGNSALFTAQPTIAPDGTLTYTPAPGAVGTATVTVQLHDSGGTVGGGQDTSAPQTFTININRAGDANRDGAVDFADLVVLAQHYGTIGGNTWATGDFNGDGNVDFTDLVQLAQNYNASVPAAVSGPAAVAAMSPQTSAVVAAPALAAAKTATLAKRPAAAKKPPKTPTVASKPAASIFNSRRRIEVKAK
jgi:serine-aspartate repeat-containing protein C/D/E